MNPGTHRLWISVAGITSILLAIWVTENEEDAVTDIPELKALSDQHAGQPASESSSVSAEPVEKLRLENLVRAKSTLEKTNPFASATWYRPPPPAPAPPAALPPPPVAPPEPTAPPLPFSFLGRYEDGNKRLVLLLRGDQMYTVAEGDSIDSNYRVKSIAGSQVEMVYLPLGTIQTIDTGEYAFAARKHKRGQ